MNTLKPLAEFYKTHAWGQGPHASGETFCLVEARLTLGHNHRSAIARELRKRCQGSKTVVDFNDAPGRTFAQVMDMLEQENLGGREAP